MEYIYIGKDKEVAPQEPDRSKTESSRRSAEKRRENRLAISLPTQVNPETLETKRFTWFRSGSSKSPFRIINLSPVGAFVEGDWLEIKSQVNLNLRLPSRRKPLHLSGRVVRSELIKKAPHLASDQAWGIGIEFSDLDDNTQKCLRTFLQAHLPEIKSRPAPSPNRELFDESEIDTFLNSNFETE